ncbi:MAG: flagellar hook basal-body protein, partial [Gammaproteobacteria bacterium]|nr:flagellar hook basal-body protein [Gammaproteobacteria bacterium]
MSDGLTISEISLQNDLKQLQAISHNLANLSTSGYKQQISTTKGFHNVIDIARTELYGNVDTQYLTTTLPKVKTAIDGHSGPVKFTDNPLEVALIDDVYLTVKTKHGEAYTRQGDLHIDAKGRLVNALGHPIVSESGVIRLTTDKPVINQQGQIYVDDQMIAQLKMIKIRPETKIKSLGGALYQFSGPSQLVRNENALRQGYLEASNVNMTDQMVKMIELS